MFSNFEELISSLILIERSILATSTSALPSTTINTNLSTIVKYNKESLQKI